MPDDNIVLEHLRHIRQRVDLIHDDVRDLKARVTSIEEGQAGINRRLDRIETRIDRIEKRLELSDAPS